MYFANEGLCKEPSSVALHIVQRIREQHGRATLLMVRLLCGGARTAQHVAKTSNMLALQFFFFFFAFSVGR